MSMFQILRIVFYFYIDIFCKFLYFLLTCKWRNPRRSVERYVLREWKAATSGSTGATAP